MKTTRNEKTFRGRPYINEEWIQYVDDHCLEYRSVPMAVVNKLLKVKLGTNDYDGIKQIYNEVPARPQSLNAMALSIANMTGQPVSIVLPQILNQVVDEEVALVNNFVTSAEPNYGRLARAMRMRLYPSSTSESSTDVSEYENYHFQEIMRRDRIGSDAGSVPHFIDSDTDMSDTERVSEILGNEPLVGNWDNMNAIRIKERAMRQSRREMAMQKSESASVISDPPRAYMRRAYGAKHAILSETGSGPSSTYENSDGGPLTDTDGVYIKSLMEGMYKPPAY